MSAPLSCLLAGWPLLAVATSDDYVFVDSFESSDCSQALSCAVPSAGKDCIAGQLTDAATAAPARARFNVGLACGSGAIGGPCDLALSAYDVLAFESNPLSPPLASAGTVVDGCGRFRFSDLQAPSSGAVAIVADDAIGGNAYAPTATPRAIGVNQSITGVNAATTTDATVALWTQGAGSPFGASSFADVGALLLTFLTNGTPTSGVTAIKGGGGQTLDDYYFSDPDSARLSVDTMRTLTGANGSVLIANASLGSYSGSGGETNGCAWTSINAASVPGVILFSELICTF